MPDSTQIPPSPRNLRLAHAISHESDRGCVLVLAAEIDDRLEYLLRSIFAISDKKKTENLFRGYGPLATFSAKVELCAALGLFSDEVNQRLTNLRRLRNDFAHNQEPLHLGAEGCKDRYRSIVGDEKSVQSIIERDLGNGHRLSPSEARRFALAIVLSEDIGYLNARIDMRFRLMPTQLPTDSDYRGR